MNFSILLLVLMYISSVKNEKTCVSFIPKSAQECFEFSDASTYCCHYSDGVNHFSDYCNYVNPAEFMTYPNHTLYGNLNMTVNCGKTFTSNNYKKCGPATVSQMSDCSADSTIEASCCYYNYLGRKGCVRYDVSIKGSLIQGNVILQCASSMIKITFTLIFIYLFLFF